MAIGPVGRERSVAAVAIVLRGTVGDVTRPTSGLTVLHGGGTDIDEIFVRMGAAAGGGDFVVIRASGTDAYNPYIYELCGCDSVETIIFKNRQAAFDPYVALVDGDPSVTTTKGSSAYAARRQSSTSSVDVALAARP